MIQGHYSGGRLGNYLYQLSCSYAHALRHGDEYCFSDTQYTKYFPKVKLVPDTFRVSEFYHEQGAGYQTIPYFNNMALVGYWQSYKYWQELYYMVLDLLDFKYDYANRTSIHIRRGDYLEFSSKHPGVPKEYLDKAMWFMAEKGNDVFEVFSDDIPWCLENINSTIYPDYKFAYNLTEDPYIALTQMANCKNQITCSSTFSLWAAELNRNENKIVITPAAENYYGPTHRDQDVKDLLRPEWHKIAWNQ